MNTLFFTSAPSNMASMAMNVPVRPTPALAIKQMIHLYGELGTGTSIAAKHFIRLFSLMQIKHIFI